MKLKHFLGAVIPLIVVVVFAFLRSLLTPPPPEETHIIERSAVATNAKLSLITEPDDGIVSIISLIENASTSVDLVIYQLEDPQIESALVADAARGVAVRVLLSAGYKGAKSSANAKAYSFLQSNHVSTRWTQDYFALTHQKSLVVDGNKALIMTFNLVPKYYSTGRDFGFIDSDDQDVAGMEDTFNIDWRGGGFGEGGNNGDQGSDLVWSPGSKRAMLSIIDNAKKSLDIYNEEMADSDVTEALINAAERGIAVHIVMTYSSQWKAAFQELTTAGADIRTYDQKAPLYIHAKMILADGTTAFVGSENFSETSLNQNRELGLMVSDPSIVDLLLNTFNKDQSGAVRFSNQ